MRSGTARALLLASIMVGAAAVVFSRPPIPQDPAYHRMADERTLLGIPNALNVLSNLPFALVGIWGLSVTLRRRAEREAPFVDPWHRWSYATIFAGALLTAAGSSYYHLAPDNFRLVWDRLPMTVAFMGLLAAIVGERVSVRAARTLLVPLVLAGTASVAYWYWGELRGSGDLRPYALVQFGSLLAVVTLCAAYPSRTEGGRWLAAGLVAYALAKGLEAADQPIFALGHLVSGHTLKHLVAAGGAGCLVAMLQARRPSRLAAAA
jgi:hypothetical protein